MKRIFNFFRGFLRNRNAQPTIAILAAGSLSLAVIWGEIGRNIADERAVALGATTRNATRLALMFRDQIDRILTMTDQALQALQANHAAGSGGFAIPSWIGASVLMRDLAIDVSLVDTTGRLRATTWPGAAIGSRIAAPAWAASRPDRMEVGRPAVDPVSGQQAILLTRPLYRPDGGADGVVMLALIPHRLAEGIETFGLEPGDAAALIGRDGIVRIRSTARNESGGQNVNGSAIMARIRGTDFTQFEGTGAVDGVHRIYSAAGVSGYPLIALVGAARRTALAPIGERISFDLEIGVVLSLLVAGLGTLSIREVNRRRRSHQALTAKTTLLSTVLDLTPAAIWIKDEAGHYQMLNETALHLMAAASPPPHAADPPPLNPLLGPELDARDVEALARPGDVLTDEHTLPAGGRDRQFLAYRQARRIGDERLVIGVAIDITPVVEAKQAIERAATAEAANRVKSEFLATMSHELRTPLNAILGFSEIIRDELFGPIGTEKYRGYVRDIHATGTHLLRIVTDILDFTRADVGTMHFAAEPIDLGREIASVVRLLHPQAAAGALELAGHLQDGVVITADPVRVRQIAFNILSNSIKFTPPGGTVGISLATGGDGAIIEFSDTGIGMDPADIENALMPFRQIDNSIARRHEGIGLGLPLARRIAELMGGSLTVTSAPGAGTRVRVVLPAAALATQQQAVTAGC